MYSQPMAYANAKRLGSSDVAFPHKSYGYQLSMGNIGVTRAIIASPICSAVFTQNFLRAPVYFLRHTD
jgi:hypothetical protein